MSRSLSAPPPVLGIMDKSKEQLRGPSRRRFLEGLAAAPVAAWGGRRTEKVEPKIPDPEEAGPRPGSGKAAAKGDGEKFIAIQVGAVSFVDEGVEKVLDIFQERAGINALMLAVFTYGRGIAGRQVPGQPLPDHGVEQYDTDTFHGGSYAAIHPQYYTHSILQNFRAPDVGEFDLLASVVPKAKARGMASYCWFEDVYNPQFLPNFEKLAEVDVYGRTTARACLNHPGVRDFLSSLVEDYIRSYEVDGVMWGSERQGPFDNALGAHHGGFNGRASLTCFCEHCTRKGLERGISVERARQGLRALEQWVQKTWAEPRPSDGYFVTLWRILLEYPEILAWEKFWSDSQQEIYGLLHGTIKNINPRLQVGWHIWHNNSFSPFYRAEQDYSKLEQVSDFLKIVMYNNCGGPRFAKYIQNIHTTMFRDVPAEVVLALHNGIL